MIHVYTGNGKGKTTAAVGLAVRAKGAGLRVLFCQFLKGGKTGELKPLTELGIDILRLSTDYGFFSVLSKEDKAEMKNEHDDILNVVSEYIENDKYDLIVLDEVIGAVNNKSADKELLMKLLGERKVELVLTGRSAPDDVLEFADYITEMKCVRHPFDKCVCARRGIEF